MGYGKSRICRVENNQLRSEKKKMKKTVSIEFEEQAKSIVTNVKIQYETADGETLKSNEEILTETKILFTQAWEYANAKSIAKAGIHYQR